jgi:Holliday junction resolvase-like predicted endonuclease
MWGCRETLMAKDIVHDVVKKALQKEGWQITKELFSIDVGEVRMEIDLMAEDLSSQSEALKRSL